MEVKCNRNNQNFIFKRERTTDFIYSSKYRTNKRINFSGDKDPSEDTLKYIRSERRNSIFYSPYTLDLNKIQDICAGIPVFENISIEKLLFLAKNFQGILLQVGCPHQCSHCALDSQSNIKYMKWDNFTSLVDGMKTIQDRLEYNLFHMILVRSVYPFADSDPMLYRSKGSDGKIHSIFDAAEYFYKKTGNKFDITTAGWYDDISQKAAENFVANPECIGAMWISVHPFHSYLEKYRDYRDKYEVSHNINDMEEAKKWKEKYISMMCNVFKTTIDLKKREELTKDIKPWKGDSFQYEIMLTYISETTANLPKNRKLEDYNKTASEALLNEICERLKKDGIQDIDRVNVLKHDLKYFGRAEKNFKNEKPKVIDIYDKEPNTENAFEGPKFIYPDGRIMSNISAKMPGILKVNFVELPIKLNFHNPVIIKDKISIPKLPDPPFTEEIANLLQSNKNRSGGLF